MAPGRHPSGSSRLRGPVGGEWWLYQETTTADQCSTSVQVVSPRVERAKLLHSKDDYDCSIELEPAICIGSARP